ncbi:hypothetical protein R1sor_003990 [Riccia sorocarpa]|uniref:CCHC-type domain-containing protein n=1 Tax=Riccia sorocarpa TaxID=122646 RepID=A0ABD3H383_9MARC
MIANRAFENSPHYNRSSSPLRSPWRSATQTYYLGGAAKAPSRSSSPGTPIEEPSPRSDQAAGRSPVAGTTSTAPIGILGSPHLPDDLVDIASAGEDVPDQGDDTDLEEAAQDLSPDENSNEQWTYSYMSDLDITRIHDKDYLEVRLQAQKRRGEDCGLVFCTVDMSPSRDLFTQWIYQEVENKAAVQATHIKVLAPRHYLVLTRSMEDRDAMLTGGPYYMRKRQVYTTPWSPGYDTSKILAKRMACWLDLVNVDHFLEGEGENLLATLGQVLQVAGVSDKGEAKFQNVRGCVLMDMSKSLPVVLRLNLDGSVKRIAIKYDTLPDACFVCQERGHFAKSCPQKGKQGETREATTRNQPDNNGFIPLGRGGRRRQPQNAVAAPIPEASSSNMYDHLGLKSNAAGDLQTSTDNNQPAQEVGNTKEHVIDLNASPQSEAQVKQDKELEKIRRKERKKAKKLEARRQRAAKGLSIPGTGSPSNLNVHIDGSNGNHSSSSDSETGGPLACTCGQEKERRQDHDGHRRKLGSWWITYIIMYSTDLKIACWNINGLGCEDKIRAVRLWLQGEGSGVKILALQELKVQERNLEFKLRSLMHGATVVTDYSTSDRGGAALLLHPSLNIIDKGVRGNGLMAWAKVSVEGKSFGVVSIYGPHLKEEKLEFFRGLGRLAGEGDWMLLGDWNMVLVPQDSADPSALLKGELLNAWQSLDQVLDTQDALEIAGVFTGPRFTRQVYRGGRLDQAQLDRLYFTRHGTWLKGVSHLQHDDQEALSDHIPVLATVHIQESRRRRSKRDTYLKMDIDTLKDPARREAAKTAWLEVWGLSEDPILAWEFAWGRMKDKFREADRQSLSELKQQQNKLAELRRHLEASTYEGEQEDYMNLERQVREKEILEASIIRRRSRVQWIKEGDVSTKFFFACLRSKQARESLVELTSAEGVAINEEDDILEEIHRYYQELYHQPRITREVADERRRALQLIRRTVTEEQNLNLEILPEAQEIDTIVEDMKKNKAPGEDGLTIEVLQLTWEWVRAPCITIITAFWSEVRLGKHNNMAIVKLLPKNNDRKFLKNWRSISLLTLTYKIIGKILAARLKEVVPCLVDDDQTGFVHGRSIIDNVISLQLCQDITDCTGEPAIFCKLDFEKAFDRVQHDYLWDTLRSMRIGQHTISLLRMLVAGGRAKVYVNGRFSRAFNLERGVRQGCPVSPLLFALNTQLLMQLLRDGEKEGRIVGVSIPRGKPLLHKLFADDSGVAIAATETNFQNLKTTIESFERISGAKLNLSKSIITPMRLDRSTLWLRETGCRILQQGELTKYLGCVVGTENREEACARDLTEKIQRQLAHWTNMTLSWPSRFILLRHVIRSIPIYQLLGLGLQNTGYKKLEASCRIFLWGNKPEGGPKTSLVIWEKVAKSRKKDGLDIKPFRDVVDALKMKYISRFLEGENSDWVAMFRHLMHTAMRRRSRGTELRWWSVEEGLLLLPEVPAPRDSLAKHFVKCWSRFRRYLSLDQSEWVLSGSLSIWQVSLLTKTYWKGQIFNERVILPLVKKLGYKVLAHFSIAAGAWIDCNSELRRKGVPMTREQTEEVNKLQHWINHVKIGPHELHQSPSWRWGEEQDWKGWTRRSNFWSRLLVKEERLENLSDKWLKGGSLLTWEKRWHLLWTKGDSTRTKLWIWRTLHSCFFTEERAYKMTVSDGRCQRCNGGIESI